MIDKIEVGIVLKEKEAQQKTDKFIEGVDYYFENGLMVLTENFLRKRGYCCRNSCRHCPYSTEEKPLYNK